MAEVRRSFFNFLKPYLSAVVTADCIRSTETWSENDKVFGKYFDTQKFDSCFEGK